MHHSIENFDPYLFQTWSLNAIKALQFEWDNVIYRLPKQWRARMIRPLIKLNAKMSCWGRWQKFPARLLELKTDLLLFHPWYAVLEILRHEIAHQIVDECFAGLDEPPHGPKFREVCLLLGSNPAASGTCPPLDQRLFAEEEEGLSEESKLVVKVRKLLALSKSANQHEAEQALLKARELSEKYELSLDEQESGSEFYMVSLGKALSRSDIVEVIISNILQDFYNVMIIWYAVPDLLNEKKQKILMVHGTKSNIKIATYTYDCIKRQIEQSWLNLLASKSGIKSGVRAKRDFAIGLLRGFRKALEKEQPEAEVNALVLQRRAHLEDFYHRLHPCIRKSSSKGPKCDKELLRAGEKVGRKLTLHPGLEADPSLPKRLNP